MEVRGGSPWPGHKGVILLRHSARNFRDAISINIKSGTCGRMSIIISFADEQIEAQRGVRYGSRWWNSSLSPGSV